MGVVLFEPHHDDAALFAAYTVLQRKPTVVTVMGEAHAQTKYGITKAIRDAEALRALRELGVTEWIAWGHTDVSPNLDAIVSDMERFRLSRIPDEVWVPLHEEGGHEHHNLVHEAARMTFGSEVMRRYATYRRGSTRTRTENEVTPGLYDPARKMRAMACYESQINLGNTQPWFAAEDMLREWIA